MDVFKIMTRRVFTCGPQDSLATAAGIMWNNDVGCAPVLDGEGRVIGMITDRDICMAGYMTGMPLSQLDVGGVMSRDVKRCLPEQTLEDAESSMRDNRVRRLPVVDQGGKLVGILSLNDLAREAARPRGRKGKELGGDEITATLAAVGQRRTDGEAVPVQ